MEDAAKPVEPAAASSVPDVAKALDEPTEARGVDHARPVLDAVDLARMMAQSRATGSKRKSSRYTALIVVVLMFIALLAIGLWLASSVHAKNSNAPGAAPEPASARAHASALAAPLSPLSPRR